MLRDSVRRIQRGSKVFVSSVESSSVISPLAFGGVRGYPRPRYEHQPHPGWAQQEGVLTPGFPTKSASTTPFPNCRNHCTSPLCRPLSWAPAPPRCPRGQVIHKPLWCDRSTLGPLGPLGPCAVIVPTRRQRRVRRAWVGVCTCPASNRWRNPALAGCICTSCHAVIPNAREGSSTTARLHPTKSISNTLGMT